MKTLLLILALPLLLVQAATANDQMRDVQAQLKSEGFYYGDVNGQESPEMTAAIRRYQIRNGLQVTGALNPETMHALGADGPAPKSEPAPAVRPPSAATTRRKPSAEESDRDFLRQEEKKQPTADREETPRPTSNRPADPSVVPPPEPATPPTAADTDYSAVFAGTVYFNAPREVQQETLRRAQAFLANRRFYRDVVNGLPGPATEEALLSFQRNARLPLTGRLDHQTLAEMRLLAGRGLNNPPLQPFYPDNAVRNYRSYRDYGGDREDRDDRDDRYYRGYYRDYPPRRVYRGVQVD